MKKYIHKGLKEICKAIITAWITLCIVMLWGENFEAPQGGFVPIDFLFEIELTVFIFTPLVIALLGILFFTMRLISNSKNIASPCCIVVIASVICILLIEILFLTNTVTLIFQNSSVMIAYYIAIIELISIVLDIVIRSKKLYAE
jgi:hypothetical protein